MTDDSELAALISQVRDENTVVLLDREEDGRICGVRIYGAPRCGPGLMPPIMAAERMREILAIRKSGII